MKDWDGATLLRDVRKFTGKAWRNFDAYHPFNEIIDEAVPTAFKSWSE